MEQKSERTKTVTIVEIVNNGNVEQVVFKELTNDKGKRSGQFHVTFPRRLEGPWIKENRGNYIASKGVWCFLSSNIDAVEKALGVSHGASKVLNTETIYNLNLKGYVKMPSDPAEFKRVRKTLEELGFQYKYQTKTFHGFVSDHDKIKEYIEDI